MNLISHTLKGQNILLINNQAGGGHKTTCESIVQQINENQGKVIVKDALNDVIGKNIAKPIYAYWNNAMKSENVKMLNFPLKIQPVAESLGFTSIFKIAHWLLKNDIQAVVNPQPAILHNITKAVRLANFINEYVRKNSNRILVYNVLTELPTPHTTDFFSTYKRLRKKDRSICKLVTTMPVFDTQISETTFWKKHTGFDIKDIIYDELPVRKPFLDAAKMDPKDIKSLKVEIKTEAALKLLKDSEIVEQSTAVGVQEHDDLENTDVHFVMLGSQAGVKSTLKYVSDFIEMNNASKRKNKQVVYVFCGDHNSTKKHKSLFEKVCNKVKALKINGEFPENLNIVPLEGQKADYVAPILRKSKTTITRAGGLTAAELYRTANNECQIFIHSTHENIFKGMPTWEAGNVMYLQKTKNAKVITKKNGLQFE